MTEYNLQCTLIVLFSGGLALNSAVARQLPLFLGPALYLFFHFSLLFPVEVRRLVCKRQFDEKGEDAHQI